MFSRSNSSTCLPWQMTFLPEAPDLSVAYAVALAAERTRHEPAPGYRLYWMASGQLGSCDVPIDAMSYLVVGRHAFCDVVLDADPSIALRHLLVRATRLDDGCPRLSVVDLHTNIGFEMNGERCERSMAATGPIAFRVGGYALIALPGGEEVPDELPKPVCSRALVAHPYRDAPVSSVTLLPPAVQIRESHGRVGGYEVGLRSAHACATVRLSSADLELGVLVGRAPKCNDTLRKVLNEGISRVHLLLRRGVAYDLASTQGTYTFGRRVRASALSDGMQLSLGTVSVVQMHLRATQES